MSKTLLRRRLPYGLFSWRFLLPRQADSIRFHRHLAMTHFPNLTRLIALPVVLITGLKWMLFHSPYCTFQVVKHKGKALKERTGLSMWQQYCRVLSISMGHGLAPIEWYQYRLYESYQNKNFWGYIYNQEIGAFHHYRNRGRPLYRKHVFLLSDKLRFEQMLKQQGIYSADTLALIPQNTLEFRSQLQTLISHYGELFCKRRTGSQGKGAFKASLQKGHLQIQPRGKVNLSSKEIDDFLKENNSQHDYLIQPNYINHPTLQMTSKGYLHPACTLRVISHSCNGEVFPEFAVIHWPVLDNKRKVKFYYPIAVDVNSGKLNKKHSEWPRESLDEIQVAALNKFLKCLSDRPLPHWQETIRLTCIVHPLLNGVDRIAWDFILTEKRAILLEGNSGWGGLAICQWFGYLPTFSS